MAIISIDSRIPAVPPGSFTHYAGKVGSLSRSRKRNDPDLVLARRNMHVERLIKQAGEVVAQWGPLTTEECDRLTALTSGAGDDA